MTLKGITHKPRTVIKSIERSGPTTLNPQTIEDVKLLIVKQGFLKTLGSIALEGLRQRGNLK